MEQGRKLINKTKKNYYKFKNIRLFSFRNVGGKVLEARGGGDGSRQEIRIKTTETMHHTISSSLGFDVLLLVCVVHTNNFLYFFFLFF